MKYIILIALTLIIPLSGSALTIEQRIEELYKLVYQLQAQLLELEKPATPATPVIEPSTTTPATTTPEEVKKEVREEIKQEIKTQEPVKPVEIPRQPIYKPNFWRWIATPVMG